MENNENLVTEQVSENTEQTAEQSPKTYTEAEFNAKLDEVLSKKIARREAKIRKEYDRQYGDLVETLKAGTGKESVDEITGTFKDFYAKKGIKIEKPTYTAKDIETLARAEADDIIRGGDEDVVEEFERLEALGAKMSAREQATFKLLAEHLHHAEMSKELAKIGVTEDEYNSPEFQSFRRKFTQDTPIADVYDIYKKTQPQKHYKTAGSMKNTIPDTNTVKDFYSYEEAMKFSKEDFDKNPALLKAVEDSMSKWK